jgi:hypothetical protein
VQVERRLFAVVSVLGAGVICAGGACGRVDVDPIASHTGVDAALFPYIDSTVPDAPFLFAGPTAPPGTQPPEVVGLAHDPVHSPAADGLPFAWRRGDPAHQLFRLTFARAEIPYDFYLPCGPGAAATCSYALPAATWRALVEASAGHPLPAVVAGTDGVGGPVSTSASVAIAIPAVAAP